MKFTKFKHIISLFIAGFVLNLYGALQKILHNSNADNILKIVFYIIATSGVLSIIKLKIIKNRYSFLNK